jgi:drug/metabolite transporter (DMT)-like permease
VPLAVICALVSSLLYALASVLQHRAAVAQPAQSSMRLGLLTRLIRVRIWLLGVGFDAVAYVLQFIALGHGSLVLVQPLLVCGLLFALPLGAWLAGGRMSARDWWGAGALVLGLSTFLVTASPGKGHEVINDRAWIGLLVVSSAAIGVLVLGALGPGRDKSRCRAGLLGAAASINYAVTAALTKAAAHFLNLGVLKLVESWQLYVLIAGGALGMLLAQSAFQAGDLDASLPVLTVVDPVVSIVIGASLFGEGVRSGLIATPIELLALILVTGGVFALSKAEVVRLVHEVAPDAP